MSKNSEMLQKLTGQIEYDRGFKEGHLTGYRQAQADIRAAKLELDYAMGLVKFRDDM
jgi:flagellar biosynthesis/type III secretory pathway protein FliH